jgi:DNA uptake protein ComE-like DNA-binding protein
MNARGRTATTYRVGTTMLIALAVSGWAAFAYVSWSAARTERALQSQITRLTADRSGPDATSKQSGHESAAPRTVYPAPYGTGAPMPARVVPSAALPAAAPTVSAQPAAAVIELVTAEQRVADLPSSSSASSAIPELASLDAQEAKRVDSAAREAGDLKLVDINTASVEELNRLGGRFGRAIVAGRPYASIDELLSKRVLTRATFSQIRDQITAN